MALCTFRLAAALACLPYRNRLRDRAEAHNSDGYMTLGPTAF